MKQFSMILCVIVFLICLSSCDKEDRGVLKTAIDQIDTSQHAEQLHEYDSPYTVCYRNKDDTYSMYIFASPIQYKVRMGEYALIDNTVVTSEKEGFAYENKANEIKTYFPMTLKDYFLVEKGEAFIAFQPDWNIDGFSRAKKTVFTNMYGDKVSAVMYQRKDMDMVFYPTKAGIKTEIVFKSRPEDTALEFRVKASSAWFENRQNGYILFKNGGENESIIYQPLVQYAVNQEQQLDIGTKMNIEKREGDYHVEMMIDNDIIENAEYPIKLDPSFELYLNKMPDTTVYSKYNVNNYLASYAVVGEHPLLGEGWHYTRMRIKYLFEANVNDIISVSYNIKGLFRSEDMIDIYTMKEQWSSTSMTWNNRVLFDKFLISEQSVSNNMYHFTITEFVKACLLDEDSLKESMGFVLNSNENHILASNDNGLYSPYIFVHLGKNPTYFNPAENINPPIF